MKKSLVLLLSGILLTLTFAGCGPEEARSQKERITDPQVTANELSSFTEDNSEFALDLYQALNEREGNMLFSPYSLSTVMAMVYAGTRGTTEQEIADVFHFELPQERLHPAFNTLDLKLTGQMDDSDGFRLDTANALWSQKETVFLPEFLDIMAAQYGAGVKLVDFNEPEEARKTINNWVKNNTEGKITDLFPPGDIINPSTVIVLTNAIYFKAKWKYEFMESTYTKDRPFYLKDGAEISVPMMRNQAHDFYYAENDRYKAVELPYSGDKFSLLILMPEKRKFDSFESSLNMNAVRQIVDGMELREVTVMMPRFTFESEYRLANTLSDMGMPSAFDHADLSGMTDLSGLYIREVVHKTWIQVDEKGTEAAAASGVAVETGMSDRISLTVDRPFIFLIRDMETGTILFIGRVMNPLE